MRAIAATIYDPINGTWMSLMKAQELSPVLLIGGSGMIGSQAAKALRKLQPALPIALGGRDLQKAHALAGTIGGNTKGVAVDIARPDLGLSKSDRFSAVVVILKDAALNCLKYAQALHLPFVTVSTQAHELGPELAYFARNPTSSVILNLSEWLTGTLSAATVHFASEFDSIQEIRTCFTMEPDNSGGPMAQWELDRFFAANPQPQILKDGQWIFPLGDDRRREVTSADGVKIVAEATAFLDVFSIAAATNAPNVRVDGFVGESVGRRLRGRLSTDYVIEIVGKHRNGKSGSFRCNISHPDGQTILTGLGAAIGVERLLGLAGGAPVEPGYFYLQNIVKPAYVLERMTEFGTEIGALEGPAPLA